MGRPRGVAGGALCLFLAGIGLLIGIFLLLWCLYRRAARHRPFAHHRLPNDGDEPGKPLPLFKCLHVSLTWFRLALKGAQPKSTGPHPRSVEALTPNSLETSQTPVKLSPQGSVELPQVGEGQVPTSPAPSPSWRAACPAPAAGTPRLLGI